jgi:hypothetical protein
LDTTLGLWDLLLLKVQVDEFRNTLGFRLAYGQAQGKELVLHLVACVEA